MTQTLSRIEPAAPASLEQSFADVLAEVLGEPVSVDGHLFDDLGADSLVMARFCARVRKRPDLPAVSMKDVYRHPSIASLATALAPTAAPAPDPPTLVAELLVEVLADVLGVDEVPADSHFFDDLGADSLVMARFCARVRKRPDLPTVSMKDVYRHPSIASLAAAFAETAPAPEEPSAAAEAAQPAELTAEASGTGAETAGGTARYVLCGTLQLMFFLGYCCLAALVITWGFAWVTAGSNPLDMYLRAVGFGAASLLGVSVLPVVAKWLLIGRWKHRRIRVWSLTYFRFWIVKTLVRSNPLLLVAGGRSHTSGSSPLYVLYLRALGAKVGRNVAIFSRNMPLCTDLLTIGDGSVIRKDVAFSGYRAHSGVIHTGSVTLGRDVFVGEASVLDIDTAMGDGSQLGHASSLQTGQAVPAGERWHGSPGQRCDVDYRVVAPARCGTLRRITHVVGQLLWAVLVYLPLGLAVASIMLAEFPMLNGLLDTSGLAFTSWAFYRDALVASGVVFVGALLIGLIGVVTVPRLLNLAVKPDRVYPLYGFHYSIHRLIGRLTNVKFFTTLFGDSSYIVYYLRALGYDLSKVEQTGSNFGTELRHETPFHVSVGSGTMIADGLSLMNADFSGSSFRVSRTSIGARNFLGNRITYPAQSTTGENCLLATKALVPVGGDIRTEIGLLGSPSFEIPRSVHRDTALQPAKRRLGGRVRAKNKYNLVSMGLFLLVRWIHVFGLTLLAMGVADYHRVVGPVAVAGQLLLVTVFTIAYFVLVERAATGFRALRPQTCSIYDRYFWWHERYWKLVIPPFDMMLAGTPFKNIVSRLLGVRLGRRVFDDGAAWPERTLVTVGDDCTLNAGAVMQGHSQEDGAFKSDRIVIGPGSTLGVNAFVHYGATVGARSVIDSDAFVMKGSDVPPGARWGGNPAGEIGDVALPDNGRAPDLLPVQVPQARAPRQRLRLVAAAMVALALPAGLATASGMPALTAAAATTPSKAPSPVVPAGAAAENGSPAAATAQPNDAADPADAADESPDPSTTAAAAPASTAPKAAPVPKAAPKPVPVAKAAPKPVLVAKSAPKPTPARKAAPTSAPTSKQPPKTAAAAAPVTRSANRTTTG